MCGWDEDRGEKQDREGAGSIARALLSQPFFFCQPNLAQKTKGDKPCLARVYPLLPGTALGMPTPQTRTFLRLSKNSGQAWCVWMRGCVW